MNLRQELNVLGVKTSNTATRQDGISRAQKILPRQLQLCATCTAFWRESENNTVADMNFADTFIPLEQNGRTRASLTSNHRN